MTAVAFRPKARAWVFSELYFPEQTSTGYFVTHIAQSLTHEFDVRAVCSQPTYSARGVVAARRERVEGVRVFRVRSTRLDKDVLPFRILNIASFTLAVFVNALLRLRRGDVVLVVTNPPLLPYAVRVAASARGARVVLLVHDVFPEALVATGMARADAPAVRLLARLSRRLYRSMDRIVVLGRDMKRLVEARLGGGADRRVVVIPNWGDVERVRPSPERGARVRERLGLRDRFIVQFMGNMGRSHDIESLVSAARALHDDPHVHFLFIGWGARRARLEDEVRRNGMRNVTVLPACSEEELPDYLNACDLAVIPFVPGMAGISVPSRMYNVMAAGRPILAVADADSELARVVNEERIGWVVPAGRAEGVAEVIREARGRPEELHAMGARARLAAETRYSMATVARAYEQLFRALSPEAPARVPALQSGATR